MRFLLLLCLSLCTLGLNAQDDSGAKLTNQKSGKLINTLNKFSVTATAGTNSFATSDLKNLTLNRLSDVSLGQLTVAYKMNSRFSFGISTMGNLSNAKSGYFNAENQFFSYCEDDDDDDDDDHDELDDDEMDDDDEECDDDDEVSNLMGTVTFKLSEKLPFFVQAGAGYTFAGGAPTYTTMIGYNQKIIAGVGIMAGIRYSDVLRQKPADAIRTISGAGLKAELGLSWNF